MLRLRYAAERSLSWIATATGLAKTTVHGILRRASAAGLDWPPPDCDDRRLRELPNPPSPPLPTDRMPPDLDRIESELSAKCGSRASRLKRQLLWREYREEARAAGFRITPTRGSAQLPTVSGMSSADLEMRFEYEPGGYLMTDFAGKTLPLAGPGTRRHAEIFVTTLAWSKLIVVAAVPAQTTQWWGTAHGDPFAYLGGVPEHLVDDNRKGKAPSA